MEVLFIAIFDFFRKNKAVCWLIMAGLFAALGFFASKVTLEEDITKMFPSNEKTRKANLVFSNTRFLDNIIVNISLADSNLTTDQDKLTEYAALLEEKLTQGEGAKYFQNIYSKIEEETFYKVQETIFNNLPFFFAQKDYKAIDSLIDPKTIEGTLDRSYKILISPASILLKKFILQDPVGISNIALGKLQNIQAGDDYEIYDGYTFSKDKKHLLIFITSAYPANETAGNTLLIESINKAIEETNQSSHNEVIAEYFGAPAVSVANATQIKKDIFNTLSIALVLILFILWLYFRDVRFLLIILLPAVFGAVFSLAVIYFIKAKISAIAIGAGTVIFGVAVDYSLHILVHYKHTGSMQTVIKDVSTAIITGCITTVGAFLCLLFVNAELLKDFGLFAGLTLFGAALFSLVFLPQLLKSEIPVKEDKPLFSNKFTTGISKPFSIAYSKYWILVIILLTIGFGYFSQYAGFESDMSKMNYMSAELKAASIHLNALRKDTSETVYFIANGKNLQDAKISNESAFKNLEKLNDQGIKYKYAGITEMLPSNEEKAKRLTDWNNYWTAEKKEALKSTLNKKAKELKFKPNSFDPFLALLDKKFYIRDSASEKTLTDLLFRNHITEAKEMTTILAGVQISPKDKPALIHLLENQPNVVIADTGNITSQFIEIVNTDLNLILTYSSILVFLILLISYGRFELAMLTFIPMMLTWVWILGIMGIFGIKFNIINIIISTFIFGLGDDYSIFIADGMLQEYKTGKKNLSSFKVSIFLSALTTIIGVGALIFAGHPAIRSIALISIIGIVCTVIISYAVIPFMFKKLILDRKQKGLEPITLTILYTTLTTYVFYLLGCLLMSALGFILFRVLRLKNPGARLFFNYNVTYMGRMIMYPLLNIHKKIINTTNEDFKKPSVIICNHQSFSDITTVLAFYPKVIVVTNEWVWNSPFFGKIVQNAGFQLSSDFMNKTLDEIEQKINDGYSILIFPEGTRSPDGEIGRFHKGAFYLAEQFKLDILPILIHGTGDIITKGDDLLVKPGTITVKYLPRIAFENTEFGSGYAERSKKIKAYFKEMYGQLKTELETPEYFRRKLVSNYVYKGPVLEWYTKIKLRIEGDYSIFQQFIPEEGNIVDIGCGYGYVSYLMSYHSKKRNILGIDYDNEKIEVANNCHSKTSNVNFINCDISTYEFEPTDTFLIIDVLHYMKQEEQKALIEKCLRSLNKDGVIVIRDSDRSLQEKHKRVANMERFATRFGFNKAVKNELHFISSEELMSIANENNAHIEKIHQKRNSSNSIFLIRHK